MTRNSQAQLLINNEELIILPKDVLEAKSNFFRESFRADDNITKINILTKYPRELTLILQKIVSNEELTFDEFNNPIFSEIINEYGFEYPSSETDNMNFFNDNYLIDLPDTSNLQIPTTIIDNFHIFKRYNSYKSKIYYRCSNYKFCKCKLTVWDDNKIYINEHCEQCKPIVMINNQEDINIYNNLLNFIDRFNNTNLTIENIILNLYKDDRFKDYCLNISTQCLRKIIKSRLKVMNSKNTSIHSSIPEDKILWEDGEYFIIYQVCIPKKMIIFVSKNIKNNIKIMQNFFIDGTFRSAPKSFYQLLSCFGYREDIKMHVPIFFALLDDKKIESYKECFQFVKNWLKIDKVKSFMVDFEKSLVLSIEEIFNPEKIYGCYFHYCQCIIRKLMKLYGKKQNHKFKLIRESILMFPYLTETAKNSLFNEIKTISELKEFIKYFEKNWVNGLYAKMLENPTKNGDRTNNTMECFHSYLSRKIPYSHPSLSQIIDIIREFCELTNNTENVFMAEGIEKKHEYKRVPLENKALFLAKKAKDLFNKN